jgi:hypothetical protein
VHDRNCDIDGKQVFPMEETGMNRMDDDLVVFLDKIYLRALVKQGRNVLVIGEIQKQIRAVHLPVLCDVYRDDIVFFVIKRVDRLMRGYDRYFMFYGFAAEEHRNIEFHSSDSSNLPYYNACIKNAKMIFL